MIIREENRYKAVLHVSSDCPYCGRKFEWQADAPDLQECECGVWKMEKLRAPVFLQTLQKGADEVIKARNAKIYEKKGE